ncbi:rhombosortase [Pseudomonadota bacterium]
MLNMQPQTIVKLRQHSIPILLGVVAIILAAIGDSATQVLRYEPDFSEFWRLLTGNFVHLGWSHLVLNVLGLALIWGLFWNTFEIPAWSVITLISSLAVGGGLFWLNPEIVWYVGLSGLLHGLFVAGALGGIRRGDRREAILLVAIIGKLLWEQAYGAMPGTADMAGGPVIVDAHLYGAIGGAIAALLLKPRMYC